MKKTDFNFTRILVTGANGWLGFQLTQKLLEDTDLKIRCLILPKTRSDALKALSDRVEVIEGDLRNPEDCRRLVEQSNGGVLFHTAGLIHPKRIKDFYDVNVEGTSSLLKEAKKVGVRRAVVVSSNSPCGCNPHPDHVFDEQSPYHPYMNYGRSKMKMEQAIRAICLNSELEYVIIRAPWFYGPGQPERQSLFFKMIESGKVPMVGKGNNRRSMAYTENLCMGLILAAIRPAASGNVYWIADERSYTMNEVVDTVEMLLEKEFGRKVAHKRVRLPSVVSDIAYLADGLIQSTGLYQQKIHVLSEMNKNIVCSIEKAKKELGYSPAVDLEEGMRRSLRWCIENGQL